MFRDSYVNMVLDTNIRYVIFASIKTIYDDAEKLPNIEWNFFIHFYLNFASNFIISILMILILILDPFPFQKFYNLKNVF